MRFLPILVLLVASCGLYPNPNMPQAPKGLALRAFERDLGMFGEEGVAPDDVIQLAPLTEKQLRAYLQDDDASIQKLLAIKEKNKSLTLSNLPRGADRVSRLARARGLRVLGRVREARTLLEGLLEEDPNFFPATHVLAWLDYRNRDYRKARREFREVLLRQPSNVSAQEGLAQSLFHTKRTKDHREAERILESLMKDPKVGAGAAEILARELLRLGLFSKALTRIQKAEKQFPKSPIFRLQEGEALFYLGDFKKAAEVVKPLTETPGPFQAQALYRRFLALRAAMDFDGALEAYLRLKNGNFQNFLKSIGKAFFLATEKILREEKRHGQRRTFQEVELQVQIKRNKSLYLRKQFLATLANVTNPEQKESVDRTIIWVLQHDPDLGLRKFALAALQQRNPGSPKPLLLGLEAKAPILRIMAASMMTTVPIRMALPKLLAYLGRERNPQVFRRIHQVLLRLSGKDVYLAPGAEQSPDGRARATERWRRALSGQKN